MRIVVIPTASVSLSGQCDSATENLALSCDGSAWASVDSINVLLTDVNCADGSFSLMINQIDQICPIIVGVDSDHNLELKASQSEFESEVTQVVVRYIDDVSSPVVYLTSLTGGQVLMGGQPQLISWTASDETFSAAPIAIDYSSDGGANWIAITAATENDGAYFWAPPAVESATVRIRLTATDSAALSTQVASASNFAVDVTPPNPALSAPLGNEVLAGGSVYVIAWTLTENFPAANPVTLYVSSDSGSTWTLVAANQAANSTYNWNVPLVNSATYQIKVVAVDQVGHSAESVSGDFSLDMTAPSVVLSVPTGGELVQGGDSINVNWSASDANFGASPISLHYSTDGSIWNLIGAGVANSGSYNWSTPALDSNSVTVKVTAIDLAGQEASATSAAFTVDSTAPLVNVTAPTVGVVTTSGSNLAIGWTASDTMGLIALPISLEYSTDSGANWLVIAASLSAAASPYNWTVPAVESSGYMIRVRAIDQAGWETVMPMGGTFTVDNSPPSIAVVYPNGGEFVPGGGNVDLLWTASDPNFSATPIKLEYSSDSGSNWITIIAATANDGIHTWVAPNVSSSTFRIRATATDQVANVQSDSSDADFSLDNVKPQVTSFALNDGVSPTYSVFINVDFQASDDMSNVTHFCLKKNTTSAPALVDACWIAVNSPQPGIVPSNSITVDNFAYQLDFLTGPYNVFGWVRDGAGNISSLGNAGLGTLGIDYNQILYQNSDPPQVFDVQGTNSDSPASPPGLVDTAFSAGGSVYIKWKVTDDAGLAVNPIALYYTTDDSTYNLIQGALPNGNSGGCSYGAPLTGCYLWSGAAPGGYFRIKVVAQDSHGQSTHGLTPPLNSGGLKILVGKSNSGLGGSAKAAIFKGEVSNTTYADPGSLVVTPTGTLFYRDIAKGILKVDPADGIQRLYIPMTGVSSGDGGQAMSATLNRPIKISLDHSNGLLIFDHNRIRRVNLTTGVISTLIGGGISTADGVPPGSVLINLPVTNFEYLETKSLLFVPLPNGDLAFQSEKTGSYSASQGARLRYFDASSGLVTSIAPSGMGRSGAAGVDLYYCRLQNPFLTYDPTSSAVTNIFFYANNMTATACDSPTLGFARINAVSGISEGPHPAAMVGFDYYSFMKVTGSGEVYGVSRQYSRVSKLNPATGTWTPILGNGISGFCADGTAALSCPLRVSDVFVTNAGMIYFVDNELIRAIDSSGLVRTVMGLKAEPVDGSQPLETLIGMTNFIERRADSGVIFLDEVHRRFREWLVGGTVQTIAGNGQLGSQGLGVVATSQPLLVSPMVSSSNSFKINPVTGDVFFQAGATRIAKLDRAAGKWQSLVGGGATNYTAADGLLGSQISFPNMDGIRVVGFDGSNILAAKNSYVSSPEYDAFLKLFGISDGMQSHLAGVIGPSDAVFCADGILTANCAVPESFYDNYAQAHYDSTNGRWLMLKPSTNKIRILQTGANVATLATIAHNASSFSYDEANNLIFYCSLIDSKVHEYNVGGAVDTIISWPVPNLKCTGRSLTYDPGTNTLTFPATIGEFYVVMEYDLSF